MADLVTTGYTIIFISILLIVGILIMATVADPMGDQFHSQETVIAAGCSDDNATAEGTSCTGTVTYPPIENVTRAVPVVINCTGTSCTTLTQDTHYNVSLESGTIAILTHTLGDLANGTIKVDYWEDTASVAADTAQQSITSTAYSGFDLAVVMLITLAAVGIVGTIFLIGRRGA